MQGQKERTAGAASNQAPIAVICGALVVVVVCLLTAAVIGHAHPSASKPTVPQPATGALVAPGPTIAVAPPSSTSSWTSAPATTPTTVAPIANVAVTTSSQPPTSRSSEPLYPFGPYIDGPVDQPHYVITFSGAPGGMLGGRVDYVYQDGHTETAFTFDGTMKDRVMSLYPGQVQTQPAGSVQIDANVPEMITAMGDRVDFVLSQCTQYLTALQSPAQCEFAP